jgi:hypothetical protein
MNGGFSDAATATALRLRVDSWTAEVVSAMRARGIRTVLLKGPVIARWLYGGLPAERVYCDCDLLVGPDDTVSARALLAELGFRAQEHPLIEVDEHHARIFLRADDDANVDLHRTLHGMEHLAPQRVWAMVGRHLTQLDVGGAAVDVPDPVLRTLNVALHPGPADGPASQPWQDLELALERVDDTTWQAALGLARELGIERELAARLRRLTAGTQLADRLMITTRGSEYYNVLGAVTTGRTSPSAYSISLLRSQPTRTAAISYALAKLFPPTEQLRRQHSLARRGPRGVLMARGLRIILVAGRLPAALVAYRRERTRQP